MLKWYIYSKLLYNGKIDWEFRSFVVKFIIFFIEIFLVFDFYVVVKLVEVSLFVFIVYVCYWCFFMFIVLVEKLYFNL